MHPVVQTVLLTFYTKGDVQYVASAALVGFWKVHREYIMFFEVSVPGQFISTLFSYYLFQLHKTSHVASASCQNAYIMDQHDQSKIGRAHV